MSEQKIWCIIDGISGVGKTTIADNSLDYTKFVIEYPILRDKREKSYMQTIYFLHLIAESNKVIENLDLTNESLVVTDRSIFSSILYDILFSLDGHKCTSEIFKHGVDNLFENQSLITLLFSSCNILFNNIQKQTKRKVVLLWIIPTNIDLVIEQLQNRQSMEVTDDFNIRYYVMNQIYITNVFVRLTTIGVLFPVESFITRHDILTYINSYT